MAKKLTPGKGGAKGMHHGHAYKETCGCAICKSKRKKISLGAGENGEVITDPKTLEQFSETMKQNSVVPTFETKHEKTQYVFHISYPGINGNNSEVTLDVKEKTLTVVVDKKFRKVFSVKDVPENGNVVANAANDVLVIIAERAETQQTEDQPVLSNETINQFAHAVLPEQEIKREPVQEKTEQPKEPEPVSLQGDIIITDETYAVMNSKGGHLAKVFQLKAGFDHGKFMNELVNRAIVFYCNNLK